MGEIIIRDPYNLSFVGTLKKVKSPIISAEINAHYTLDFETIYQEAGKLIRGGYVLEVDNEYFQVIRPRKSLSGLSYKIYAEHISYRLVNAYDSQNEEYEDTAHGMLTTLLLPFGGTFTIGEVAGTEVKYYKPALEDSIRTRIIAVANLFGLEIIWHKFSVSLVAHRGPTEYVEFKVGENLIGIEEDYDLNTSYIPMYSVDLLDLAEVPGYEETELLTIQLGGNVHLDAEILDIDFNSRVYALDYDPFKKSNVQVKIGQVPRDFIDYMREQEEKEGEDDENKTMLQSFKVGDIDCIPIMSDETSAVLDYLTNTSLQGIVPSADCELIENKKGVTAALKSASGQYLTAMVTTETELGITSSFKPMPAAELANLELPKENLSVSIIMIVTKVPFADLASGLVPIPPSEEEDDEQTFLEAYGVRFVINISGSGFLEDFKVGDVDCLAEVDIDAKEQVVKFIKGQVTQPIAVHSFEIVEGKLKGIYANLKEDYKKYHLTFIHSSKDANDTWTVETKKMPFTNARIFETPKHEDDSVIMVITKEPYESITSANVDSAFLYAFGVRFKKGKETEEEGNIADYLNEFRIGDVDVLSIGAGETEQVKSYIRGEVTQITASTRYQTPDILTGLFTSLKSEYANYHLTAINNNSSGSFQVVGYSSAAQSWKYPITEEGTRSTILVVTEQPFETLNAGNVDDSVVIAFGIKVEIDETSVVTEQKMYLEYGSVTLSNVMNLTFEKGPYDEVYSITTGITSGGEIEPVTIVVEALSDGSGLIAYAADTTANATVNFQAVCMKIEKVEKE